MFLPPRATAPSPNLMVFYAREGNNKNERVG